MQSGIGIRHTANCEICGAQLDKPHYSFDGYPMTCDNCCSTSGYTLR